MNISLDSSCSCSLDNLSQVIDIGQATVGFGEGHAVLGSMLFLLPAGSSQTPVFWLCDGSALLSFSFEHDC